MRSPRRPAPLTSTESSGWNPLIARKIAGLRVRAGVGWGRRPFLLMVSRLESLDVMFPYMRGFVLSRSMSRIRSCWALGALPSEVPATAGYPQWIHPALTSNSAKKQDRGAENVRRHPPDPFTYAPRARAQSSGWRRRRTLGDCRAGLRMAAGLFCWGVSRTGGFVD